MGFGETIIALTGTALVFGIPLSVIWTYHHRKMLELKLKLQGNGQDETLRREIAALREEMHSLRDTAMQYDLSFDTALQSMEQRVGGLERQTRAVAPPEEAQTVVIGGRT